MEYVSSAHSLGILRKMQLNREVGARYLIRLSTHVVSSCIDNKLATNNILFDCQSSFEHGACRKADCASLKILLRGNTP